MKIVPVDEHQMLVFWVQVFVLVAVARLLGAAMKRAGQPAVVGELAAGLVLGPSVLGKLWPAGGEWLFPPEESQSAMLLVVGWVGIVMLLVVTGFETDLALIRRLGRATVFVAGASVVLPFLLGLVLGYALPASFLAADGERGVFALFVAAALSISSLPVIAKILSELGLTRRNFGQVILAAGMANDVVGWLILGVIAGIAKEGSFDPAKLATAVVGMGVFLALSFTVGQRLVDGLLRRVRRKRAGVEGGLAAALVVAVGAGAVTQALGVEAVLGAFVAGIVLSRSRFQDGRVLHHLEAATGAFFAPLFFATAGLRVDLALLGRADVIGWTVAVVAVATLGKFAGAYVGGRLASLAARESLALGVGLNARGALEIVIATVGLSLGILNDRAYTVVVVMAIATSMAAPPMLRALATGWKGSDEEQQRLELEETLSANVLVRPGRFLVVAQDGPSSTLAARLLDATFPPEGHAASVVAVDAAGVGAAERVAASIERRPADVEVLAGEDPVEALLDHTELGYAMVGIGATRLERTTRRAGALLSPLPEALAGRTPVPMLLVWGARTPVPAAERAFDRIVVPVVGTRPNRAAQEFAFSAAAALGAEVVAVHITPPPAAARAGGVRTATRPGTHVAHGILAESVDLATRLGVTPTPVVRESDDRASAIAELVAEFSADLVVLSAELQPVAGAPFLGNLVEEVLTRVRTTVAVVAVPPEWVAPTPP
ncbi:MAG TPA: cation:proton antiporter [Acidimicrobiales bacterium]|nr:cation:proton antiporter [Acidimicrobiales bacterium]